MQVFGYAEKNMNSYTAVIKNEGDVWIGWIEEIPGINCQENTKDELMQALKITLAEALEFNRADARGEAGDGFEEQKIAI